MANVTNVTITVESILKMAIENLAPNLDNVRAELEAHNSESDKFKPIIAAQRKIDAGNGWANLNDQFRADIEISEKYNNPVLLANARANMQLLGEFRKWEARREQLEQEIESGIAPLRELVSELTALTGDSNIHKIHTGGKTKSRGGYECHVFRDNTIVENDHPDNIFTGINPAWQALLGHILIKPNGEPYKLDPKTGKRPYQNKPACMSQLRNAGYTVKFIAQNTGNEIKYIESEEEVNEILNS